MKTMSCLLIMCIFCACGYIQQNETDAVLEEEINKKERPKTIMLFGASFAYHKNGWFEIGCTQLGARAINKAVSGHAIYNNAVLMAKNEQYTLEELDDADLLVIMQVHNKDVFNREEIKENINDYSIESDYRDYAGSFDYVIKKYKKDCEELEFNENSKYFKVKGGKPVKIMFATHWHDSRTIYNESIRKLSFMWNIPLLEFDKNIGFSKDDIGNADPGEPSRNLAVDTEVIDNVVYGWHPKRGENEYIQKKMAEIFVKAVNFYY